MEHTFKQEDIEQILAEADELLQQLDPEIIKYLEDEQRAQLEKQTLSLKQLKTEIENKIGMEAAEAAPESSSYGEGIHEAIEDIMKAMKGLAGYLS